MGIFERIKKGLTKTREQLTTKIEWALKGRPIDEEAFDEVEEALLLSDVGVETSRYLIDHLKERWKRGYIKTEEDIKQQLTDEIAEILRPVEAGLNIDQANKPFVILTTGVNGVGKTTTIAKLGSLYLKQEKRVIFGACDTFRAAAIEQLETWAKKVAIEVVKQKDGADPAAVAFDTIRAAKARNIDIVILDTAGRLHTKSNLMEEMKKIKRVVGKEIEGSPHEVLLIVDATNGQNAVNQAKTFREALGVTGLAITKLDGTAKGGFILPIAHLLNVPIRYVGVGEAIDDLIPFNATEFAKALLS